MSSPATNRVKRYSVSFFTAEPRPLSCRRLLWLTGPCRHCSSYGPTNQTCKQRIGWPTKSNTVGHPSVATSVQGESLGSDLLAQEFFGFGFFFIPLLQLFGAKEVDDPLTNRIAICNNLADDIGSGRAGILLYVLCDFSLDSVRATRSFSF